MTNPTTNFGWVMPSATDLVTDLPADFDVFGQAVDTDFVDLLGGANGYILSKASAADLDFTWIANDQGDITGITATSPLTGGGSSGAITVGIQDASTAAKGSVQLSDSTSTTSSVLASTPTATKSAYDLADAAIAKTTVTTAGDIIYRNATVPARLGIGTANQVLAVNSGATAPEWKTPSSGAITLITRQSFSGVANTGTSFDGVFTSTYKTYFLNFENFFAVTDANDTYFRFRYAGPTTETTNYYWQNLTATKTATSSSGTDADTQIQLAIQSGASAALNSGQYYVNMVGNSSQRASIIGQTSMLSTQQFATIQGVADTQRTYTGFILSSSSSNITGTVSVYGLATS